MKRARSATVDDTSSRTKLLESVPLELKPSHQVLLSRARSTESLADHLNMADLLHDDSDDDEDDDDLDEDEDDELENGFLNYENNYQDELQALEGSPEDDIFNNTLLQSTGDYFSDSDGLSPMSEEDDSMLDEDLEFAARQMKASMAAGESTSLSVPSSEHSPRRRATTTSSSSSGFPLPVSGKAASVRRVTTSETSAWDKSNVTTSNAAHQRRMSAPNRPRKILFDKEKRPKVSLEFDAFSKHAVETQPVQTSSLSSLIKIKQSTFDNPLEQYISASGKSEKNPLLIKVYMPTCSEPRKSWDVLIRRDVSVTNAIGFALYCYEELKRLPPLTSDLLDSNKWNMHIVEDDGEPDDDFPALDRTRLISAYSFDEFALVKATPAQAAENERITPMKKSSKESAVKREEPTESTSTTLLISVYQYPFDIVLSKPIWTSELAVSTTILSLLDEVCKKKELDIDKYVLKTAGTRQLIYPKMTLAQLENGNMELTPRRVISITNGFSSSDVTAITKGTFLGARPTIKPVPAISSFGMRSISANSIKPNASASVLGTGMSTASALINNEMLPGSLGGAGYEKYTVWRRQPMSFISRHERILAIDGDYIHIMPSDEKTFFDSPKTSSFHINQVLKCKQSRKIPANFKIVVMKTTGPKRYDLEAPTAAISATIVDRIRTLAGSFKGSGPFKRDFLMNLG